MSDFNKLTRMDEEAIGTYLVKAALFLLSLRQCEYLANGNANRANGNNQANGNAKV